MPDPTLPGIRAQRGVPDRPARRNTTTTGADPGSCGDRLGRPHARSALQELGNDAEHRRRPVAGPCHRPGAGHRRRRHGGRAGRTSRCSSPSRCGTRPSTPTTSSSGCRSSRCRASPVPPRIWRSLELRGQITLVAIPSLCSGPATSSSRSPRSRATRSSRAASAPARAPTSPTRSSRPASRTSSRTAAPTSSVASSSVRRRTSRSPRTGLPNGGPRRLRALRLQVARLDRLRAEGRSTSARSKARSRARSSAVDGVRAAQVQLVLPKQSLFLDEGTKASAAVLLTAAACSTRPTVGGIARSSPRASRASSPRTSRSPTDRLAPVAEQLGGRRLARRGSRPSSSTQTQVAARDQRDADLDARPEQGVRARPRRASTWTSRRSSPSATARKARRSPTRRTSRRSPARVGPRRRPRRPARTATSASPGANAAGGRVEVQPQEGQHDLRRRQDDRRARSSSRRGRERLSVALVVRHVGSGGRGERAQGLRRCDRGLDPEPRRHDHDRVRPVRQEGSPSPR